MRIAVASEGNNVSGHFGHCAGFTMFDVEDNKIVNKEYIESPGHKPGFLPVFLNEKGANVIIAGGMGEHAQELFAQNNIQVVVGAVGSIEENVDQFIKGALKSTGSVCREHEHEGHCND
ncbi:dinitrogenase iron-molybdenum cofactor [Clostridium novyi A str. 4570]|uniref:Dinitrogenase iron-molybdenum cofactor n=1 Tax=Clostridium novyi A str. 4570 TaxID=1444290 RepID=A0AA88ZNH9_CLONO|nr:NifB/NifX family molybdenum-iron cluster-binding protein [Clostridium novyi]KGN00879.1 dinitrogenase iron-molybdenum cofactor [Clostridium novyi A str. 4570]